MATDSVEKRKEHDMKFLTEVCNIPGDDIDHAFRAGRLIKEGDPAPLRRNGKPRGPLEQTTRARARLAPSS